MKENWEPMENAETIEEEVNRLMNEIDERVNRFVQITGARGKQVKKRWRDIKKSRKVME